MLDEDLLQLEDRVRLLVNALANERDPFPVLKLFTPDANATWLVSECDPDEPDRPFGLADLGLNFPDWRGSACPNSRKSGGTSPFRSNAMPASSPTSRFQPTPTKRTRKAASLPNTHRGRIEPPPSIETNLPIDSILMRILRSSDEARWRGKELRKPR